MVRAQLAVLSCVLVFASPSLSSQGHQVPPAKHAPNRHSKSFSNRSANPNDSFIQKIDKAMLAGKQAAAARNFGEAEKRYREAVILSRSLPARFYAVKSNALKQLAEVLDYQKKVDEAESLLNERVEILERDDLPDDLEIGLALFDLESHYGGTQKIELATQTAERAVKFYKSCMAWKDDRGKICDRRMADVQGLMGSVLFIADKHDESEPWFKAVVLRDDESVRPEVMLVSLQAYSKLLIEHGEILESVKMANRAGQFGDRHPEAKRAVNGGS